MRTAVVTDAVKRLRQTGWTVEGTPGEAYQLTEAGHAALEGTEAPWTPGGVTSGVLALELSLERIIQESGRKGISDIRALVDRHGRLRPIAELSADAAAAVSSVKVTRRSLGDGTTETVSEDKLQPKLKALELIAKLRGLLGQKVTVETGESWRDILLQMSAEDDGPAP